MKSLTGKKLNLLNMSQGVFKSSLNLFEKRHRQDLFHNKTKDVLQKQDLSSFYTNSALTKCKSERLLLLLFDFNFSQMN